MKKSRKLTSYQWAVMATVRSQPYLVANKFENYEFTGEERTAALSLVNRGFLVATNKAKTYFRITRSRQKLLILNELMESETIN